MCCHGYYSLHKWFHGYYILHKWYHIQVYMLPWLPHHPYMVTTSSSTHDTMVTPSCIRDTTVKTSCIHITTSSSFNTMNSTSIMRPVANTAKQRSTRCTYHHCWSWRQSCCWSNLPQPGRQWDGVHPAQLYTAALTHSDARTLLGDSALKTAVVWCLRT